MKKFVFALIFTLTATAASQANAQICSKAPTCAELGYNTTASLCRGQALKCPFDLTKAFCILSSSSCFCPSGYSTSYSCSNYQTTAKDTCGRTCYKCWKYTIYNEVRTECLNNSTNSFLLYYYQYCKDGSDNGRGVIIDAKEETFSSYSECSYKYNLIRGSRGYCNSRTDFILNL